MSLLDRIAKHKEEQAAQYKNDSLNENDTLLDRIEKRKNLKNFESNYNNLLTELKSTGTGYMTSEQSSAYKAKVSNVLNQANSYKSYISNSNIDEAQKSEATKSIDQIINDLNDYSSWLDEASEVFGQYESREAYDAAVRQSGYSDKYSGLTSYTDVMSYLDSNSGDLSDEERGWLRSYAYSVATIDELESALKDKKNEIARRNEEITHIVGSIPNSTENQQTINNTIKEKEAQVKELETLCSTLKTNIAKKKEKEAFDAKWSSYEGKTAEYDRSLVPVIQIDSDGFGSVYDYLNASAEGREEMLQSDVRPKAWKLAEYMTEEEKGIYNYLYATEGKKRANEYLKDLESLALDDKINGEVSENFRKWAGQNTGTAILGSLASIPLNLVSGLEYLGNAVTGNADKRSSSAVMANALREGTKDRIDSDVWDFVYDTAMSGADSLAAVAVGVATGGGSWVASGLVGAAAAAETANSMIDRGITSTGQILTTSLLSGAYETIFEKISLGKLSSFAEKGAKQILKEAGGLNRKAVWGFTKEIGDQVFVNASEEFVTEVANMTTDYLINGGLSEYAVSVDEYYKAGYSLSEAKNKAMAGSAERLALAAAGGALQGLMFGGVSTAVGTTVTLKDARTTGKIITADSKKLSALKKAAKNDGVSADLKSQIESFNKNSGVTSVGLAANMLMMELTENSQAQLTDKLKSAGMNSKSAENTAGRMVSAALNRNVSGKDVQSNAFTSNDTVNGIYSEFAEDGQYGGRELFGFAKVIMKSETVDNKKNNGYNNTYGGRPYERTDEFRELQAASQGMSDEDIQLYRSGNRQLNEKLRGNLAGILQSQIRSNANGVSNAVRLLNLEGKNNQFNVYENVDSALFHDVFEIVRKYLKFGELVDLHGIETTEDGIGYNDCYNYLSEDGLSGFSITPDGDLISVFNASGKAGFLYSIAQLVKERAKTLDCYASVKQDLRSIYERVLGFKTASVMDYNMEYDHDDIAANHDSPKVAFMVNTDADVETKSFTKDQYDEAKAYRDSFVKRNVSPAPLNSTAANSAFDAMSRVVTGNNINKNEEADLNGAASSVSGKSSAEDTSAFSEPDISNPKDTAMSAMQRVVSGGKRITTEEQQTLKAIGKKLGVGVEFDYDGEGNGYYENGVIHFNPNNCKSPLKFIFKHELVHHLENSKLYGKFQKYLFENSPAFKDWLSSKGTTLVGYRNAVRARYRNAGMTDVLIQNGHGSEIEGANYEIVADFVGDKLFGSNEGDVTSDFLSELQRENRNIFERFADWVKSMIARLKGTTVEKDLIKIQQKVLRLKETATTEQTDKGKQYSIAGENAKTANISTLNDAKSRIANGEDSETVRQETGWFKGYDGKWRFEIDDIESHLIENPKLERHTDGDETYFVGKLSDILDHKELFESYPELKDINIIIQPTNIGVEGIYQPNSNCITLSIEQFKRYTKEYKDYLNGDRKAEIERIEQTPEYQEYNKLFDDPAYDEMNPAEWLELETAAREKFYSSELGKRYHELKWGKSGFTGEKFEFGWENGAKAVLMHEVQHAVQRLEGFASGANTNNPHYDRVAGEIESRDVEKRLNYTTDQRKNTRPDIDRTDVVFAKDISTSYSLRKGAEADVERALNDKNYTEDVFLTESSPSIIASQKGTRNLPMLMKASHVRENIFTEQEAKQKGLKVNSNINYHGLGKDLFLKVIDGLDDVKLAYRGTKNASDPSRRENYFLLISQYKDANGNTINVPVFINEKGQYNRVFIDTNKIATVFGRDNLSSYIQKEIKNGNLVRIKNKSTQASELTSPINASYSKNAFTDTTVPQKAQSVNTSISENVENSTEKLSDRTSEADLNESDFSTSDKGKQYSLAPEEERTQINDAHARYENGEITATELAKTIADITGAIQKGENPKVDVTLPEKVGGRYVHRFDRTLLESGHASPEVSEAVAKDIIDGARTFDRISNESLISEAAEKIDKDYQAAVEEWMEAINSGKSLSDKQLVLGQQLMLRAAEENNVKDVMAYTAELAEAYTRAGREVQTARILKKLTPEGKLYYLSRAVATLNKDLKAKYKDKFTPIEIPDDIAEQILSVKTSKDMDAAVEEAMRQIGEQIPSTFLDKFNAWRYLAMLGNPKTHVRNIVGNAVFWPAYRIKDGIGAIMELTRAKENRTKTLSPFLKSEYRAAAIDYYEKIKDTLINGREYGYSDKIDQYRRVFKNKLLEKIRRFNSEALEAEDAWFLRERFIRAMGGYLQARGVDLSTVDETTLEKAAIYAETEAKKATYREACEIAEYLKKASRSKNAALHTLGVFIDGVLPFKKTPINILKRGLEYSPVGLVKSLKQAAWDLRKGKITASEFIDGLAASFTGTGILALGMWLASQGILSAGMGDDKEDWFNKSVGEQEYAIKIGDFSYTIDWMVPAALPLFVGTEIWELSQDGTERSALTYLFEGLSLIGEPFVNLSMLSGLNDVIDSVSYSDDKISEFFSSALANFAGQVFPTIGGQIARISDDTRRTNYIDKNSDWPAVLQIFWQKMAGKIPGLEQTKAEYINVWGETEKTGTGQRILENTLSPGYASTSDWNKLNTEVARVYTETGEAKALPKSAEKSFKVNGETKYLTADEWVKYARTKGKKQKEYVENIIGSSAYKMLDDGAKAEVLSKIYSYAGAIAKTEVSDYELSAEEAKVKKLESAGVTPGEYFIAQYSVSKAQADTDGSGGVSKSEYLAGLKKSGLSQSKQDKYNKYNE